jgi:hypothetical protein
MLATHSMAKHVLVIITRMKQGNITYHPYKRKRGGISKQSDPFIRKI